MHRIVCCAGIACNFSDFTCFIGSWKIFAIILQDYQFTVLLIKSSLLLMDEYNGISWQTNRLIHSSRSIQTINTCKFTCTHLASDQSTFLLYTIFSSPVLKVRIVRKEAATSSSTQPLAQQDRNIANLFLSSVKYRTRSKASPMHFQRANVEQQIL